MKPEYDNWPESLIEVFEKLVLSRDRVTVEYGSGIRESGVLVFYNLGGLNHPGIEIKGVSSVLWADPVKLQTTMETIWSMERDEPILWVHLQ